MNKKLFWYVIILPLIYKGYIAYGSEIKEKWGTIVNIKSISHGANITLECMKYPEFQPYYFEFFASNDIKNLQDIRKGDFINVYYTAKRGKPVAIKIDIADRNYTSQGRNRSTENRRIWQEIEEIKRRLNKLEEKCYNFTK